MLWIGAHSRTHTHMTMQYILHRLMPELLVLKLATLLLTGLAIHHNSDHSCHLFS